ncbi:MAG: MaoC/PaaZ C-terminal domain-containing protein [Acidimicrobiia bacterium]
MTRRTLTWTATAEAIAAFSGGGRTLPLENLHTDVEVARSIGFDDVVAQGIQQVAVVAADLRADVGPDWDRGGRVMAKFLSPVLPGMTVEYVISETEPGDGERRRFSILGSVGDTPVLALDAVVAAAG